MLPKEIHVCPLLSMWPWIGANRKWGSAMEDNKWDNKWSRTWIQSQGWTKKNIVSFIVSSHALHCGWGHVWGIIGKRTRVWMCIGNEKLISSSLSHIRLWLGLCVCVCACVCLCVCACLCVCTHMYGCSDVCVHWCRCAYLRVCDIKLKSSLPESVHCI